MVLVTIVVLGELDARFGALLPDLAATVSDGRTELHGHLIDQAQVQGVLHQLFDLGIEVVSFVAAPVTGETVH